MAGYAKKHESWYSSRLSRLIGRSKAAHELNTTELAARTTEESEDVYQNMELNWQEKVPTRPSISELSDEVTYQNSKSRPSGSKPLDANLREVSKVKTKASNPVTFTPSTSVDVHFNARKDDSGAEGPVLLLEDAYCKPVNRFGPGGNLEFFESVEARETFSKPPKQRQSSCCIKFMVVFNFGLMLVALSAIALLYLKVYHVFDIIKLVAPHYLVKNDTGSKYDNPTKG